MINRLSRAAREPRRARRRERLGGDVAPENCSSDIGSTRRRSHVTMRSPRLTLLGLAAVLATVSLCTSVTAALTVADPPPRAAFAAVRLYPLPKRALTQCHLARAVQLCPRRLPRASLAYRAGATPPELTAERFRPLLNGGAFEAGISFSYGAPWEPDSGPDWQQHAWRNRPCCFLHFDLWHAVRGKPTFPETTRPATVGGVHGDLALATGAGLGCGPRNAGVYFCNHVRFRWKQGGMWFVATLHSFGNAETRALLGRIIRELRPIATLPRP